MPAGMVRPRASLAPRLGSTARHLYRAAGWTVGSHGTVGMGGDDTSGPCARCRQPCIRYGPTGGPLCTTCRTPREDT